MPPTDEAVEEDELAGAEDWEDEERLAGAELCTVTPPTVAALEVLEDVARGAEETGACEVDVWVEVSVGLVEAGSEAADDCAELV